MIIWRRVRWLNIASGGQSCQFVKICNTLGLKSPSLSMSGKGALWGRFSSVVWLQISIDQLHPCLWLEPSNGFMTSWGDIDSSWKASLSRNPTVHFGSRDSNGYQQICFHENLKIETNLLLRLSDYDLNGRWWRLVRYQEVRDDKAAAATLEIPHCEMTTIWSVNNVQCPY